MNVRPFACTVAIGFFFFWLIVLLAGADKPPPPGFIFIVLFDLSAALVVYRRMPKYLEWYAFQQKNCWPKVLLDGFAAGLVLVLLTILLPGGELGIPPLRVIDYIIWFSVLGLVGIFNSVIIYLIGAVYTKLALIGQK